MPIRRYTNPLGSFDEYHDNSTPLLAPLSDLFLGLVGVVIVSMIALGPLIKIKARVDSAGPENTSSSLPVHVDRPSFGVIGTRLISVTPIGITFQLDGAEVTVTVDKMLQSRRMEQKFIELSNNTLVPFILIENNSGEAAFLMDILLSRSNFDIADKVRLAPACRSVSFSDAGRVICQNRHQARASFEIK